jgi:endoglucanase
MPLLRRFSALHPQGPWDAIARNAMAVLSANPQTRLTPDWVAYRVQANGKGEFFADPEHGDRGSYDAIRSYLWAGVTAPADAKSRALLQAQRGMADLVSANAAPPESVSVASGQVDGSAPFGFSSALVPYLYALGEKQKAAGQQRLALAQLQQAGYDAANGRRAWPYYDYVLSLFGLGWQDGRYRFLASGQLQPSWKKTCLQNA